MISSKCAFTICLLAARAWAQSSSGITGLVTDQTGLPVPAVRVTAAAGETHTETAVSTNHEGYYNFAALPPGTYKISAHLEGFKVATGSVSVTAGATARLDLALSPGDARQVIEVRADAAQLDTTTGMLSDSISQHEIESMPLGGRNAIAVALTLAGVSGELGSDEGGVFQDVPTAGAGLTIAGGRASSSAFLADGANATSIGIARVTATFSPDTIQEVQVITSTFSAKYGVSGGGVVNTVSRAGTDRLRGTLYWFAQNPALNARQFNRPLPSQVRRNEAGLTLGGPIVVPKLYDGRRRTFFFLSVEPKRWRDAVDIYDRFPTLAERQGDFRNSYAAPGQRRPLLYQQVRCVPAPADCRQLVPIHRPSSTAEYPLFSADDPDPTRRGHVIPKAYLDPLVQKILQDVPLPNQPYDAQGMNYYGERGVNGSSNRWSLKLDHNFSANNRLSGRYTEVPNYADRYRVQKDQYFFSLASDRSITRQVVVNDSHILSPRVINELRAAYTLADYSRSMPGDLATTNYTKDLFGLPSQTSWGYPRFNSGFGSYGFTGSALGTYIEHQYQAADDLTMNFGKHVMSIGTDWRLLMLNDKSSGLTDACCGTYAWAAAQTNSGNANTPGGTGGIQFASFLLGVPNSAALRGVVIPYYYRWKVGAAYFQDDYKVRRNLTLNLGVRWQYNSPRWEKYNRQATVDLDHPLELTNAAGQVTRITFNYLFSGYNGRSIYLEPAHKRDFEPRFGFAWVPSFGRRGARHIVVRGGYGISHSPTTGRGRDPVPDFGAGSSGSWTYTRWNNNNPPPLTQGRNPNYLISIGRNQPVVKADPSVLRIPINGILCDNCPPRDARVPGGAIIYFSPRNSSPYVQTWNLTTQFDLGHELVATVSYLGHKGTHLYSPQININRPDPTQYEELLNAGGDPNEAVLDPLGRVGANGSLITTTLVNLMRPFPAAGDINVAGLTNSNSIYNAGTFSLDRRYSRGLSLRVNYTWSKSIDTTSDANLNGASLFAWGPTRLQDSENLRTNRSVSTFDMRHRLNLVLLSELPFGRRRRWLANASRITGLLVSNWSFNLLGSLYSGVPFAPYLGDANGVPSGATGTERIRPDLIPGVPVINPRWSKNVANDVPYFNPEAFARPAYGHLGNAARTLDFARNPWRQTLNASLFRDFFPFENRQRHLQFRTEFYNALNHATFTTSGGNNESPNLFSSAPPVSRTGLSLAGPIPYLAGLGGRDFPVGTRENLLAANYNQNFGKLWRDRNGPGRVIQLALKIYF